MHFSKGLYLLNISGSAGVSMTRYIKNSDKSHIVPITTLSLDFDESLKKRLSTNAKIRFDATFDLGQHVDTSIVDQDLVSYSYFTTNINVRYNHSTKFGVGGGTSYSFKDYQSGSINSYNDLSTLPLSLRAFYIYSENLTFLPIIQPRYQFLMLLHLMPLIQQIIQFRLDLTENILLSCLERLVWLLLDRL